MTPVPILVQAEQVRQPTYRFRYAIAPQPPQTSLSAKCRTLTARAVLAPLVSDKNRSDVTTITLDRDTNVRRRLERCRLSRCGLELGGLKLGGLELDGLELDGLELGGQARRDARLQKSTVLDVLGGQHLTLGVGPRDQVTAAVRHGHPDLDVEPRQGG